MTVLSVILGILIAVCGVCCLFVPILTTSSLIYFMMALFLVYGIFGIIRCAVVKNYGALFIFSIISTVLGACLFFTRGAVFATELFFMYVIAGWMVVQGIFSIIASIRLRGVADSSLWIAELIMGIIAVLMGLVGFAHPLLVSFTIGIMLSISIIESGISMIVTAIQKK